MIALLLSLFLAADASCLNHVPATFTNSTTVASTVFVCANIPVKWCGITYGFDYTPAGNGLQVLARNDLLRVDITQPPTFPFTVGTDAPNDLGFTSLSPVEPFAPVLNSPIASYQMRHTGVAGVTYSLKLRTTQSSVSVGINGDCISRDTDGPQFIDVPLDGKLPPPAVLGVRKSTQGVSP